MKEAAARSPGKRTEAPPAIGIGPVEAAQYLTFVLEREVFAIGILVIKEIIEYSTLTQMPMMPAWICGVINLRGAGVPVMDLPVRFGRPATAVTKRTCIIIVEVALAGRRQDVGLVVDAVNAVLELSAADIEPAPAFGAKINTDFIQGIGRVGGRFVIILDVDRIVTLDELGSLAEAGAGVAGAGR